MTPTQNGVAVPARAATASRPSPAVLGIAGIANADLPPELIAQLSCLPEDAPEDFACAICGDTASNRWHYSARDYERPPVCKRCETVTGYAWHGANRHRTKPSGGSHRDKREALRIGALADAIAEEANRQIWSKKHGCA